MISEEVKRDALDHANREYPRESCGLVVLSHGSLSYFPCKNISLKNDQFIMEPMDYMRAEDGGDIVAVIHSHPDLSPKPSQADLVSCELSGLPWHIVAVPIGTWESLAPSGYKAPLIGRQFKHGVLDCYAIIRDFYKEEYNIDLPDFERQEEWWKKGDNLYLENIKNAGFKLYDGPIERGDVILMQIGAKVINHAAVYLGNDQIIHHLSNQLSTRDVYGGQWRKCTRSVIRYCDINKL